MIEIKNVTKSFIIDTKKFNAVNNVSLSINDGEIFGIIGYSGAGKSTLVRCINMLERPDAGDVLIKGTSMTQLSKSQLREKRKDVGMIFQHFNLMQSRTVEDNVALALSNASLTKTGRIQRVRELLELVGIADKAKAYPSHLSGGQKQRVAIARALANYPAILLCDEATSALDPQTTQTILDLLKKLNQTLGLTIVIITHEMHVVKSICDRVGVMEHGHLREVSKVTDLFTHPQADISKEFVQSTSSIKNILTLISEQPASLNIKDGDAVLKLTFTGANTKEAILSTLTKTYQIDASIIFANIEVIHDEVMGIMIVIMRGERTQEALTALGNYGISWEEVL